MEDRKVDGVLPDQYNIDKLGSLSLAQIAFWDETHKKILVGTMGANNTQYQVRFRRDEFGCPVGAGKTGTLTKEGTRLNMKYSSEVRLCLGVAKQLSSDGTEEGSTLPLFNYTGQTIVTIKDWDRMVENEKKRVKGLKGEDSIWVNKKRIKGELYLCDGIKGNVKHCGKATFEAFDKIGIKKVRDIVPTLVSADSEISRKLIAENSFITDLKMKEIIESARAAKEKPKTEDHRGADNPYYSKYKDDWENKIAKCKAMSKYVCIKRLVKHIVEETHQHYEGTEYAESWLFYHDALSLMTCKGTIEWMKTQTIGATARTYHDCWMLPKFDLNAGTSFEGRVVGNSPEMHPMDNTLNKDVDDSVKRHVAYTYYLAKDDSRKFSMATPKEGVHAYARCWNNPPVKGKDGVLDKKGSCLSSKRILGDINKFSDALNDIWVVEGAVVDQNNKHVKRSGHRAEQSRELTKKFWGGKQIKQVNQKDKHWIHVDAQVAWDGLIEKAEKLTMVKMEKLGEMKSSKIAMNGTSKEDCAFDDECVNFDCIKLGADCADKHEEIKVPHLEDDAQQCLDPDAYANLI